MIPIKLELTNFMAYRNSDPLDLSGLHVVCLTGENGAGKSTLLDAITWALWGEARARRDEELITQGEGEMRVALTFSEGTHLYQVIRSRKVGKANKSGKVSASSGELNLVIFNEGTPRVISEDKTGDTQQKIIKTLNLTYDTFINSAFLKQGRADEFAIKTPTERKKLLTEILNLQIWQGFDEKAKKLQDGIEREEALRQSDFENAEAEIAKLPQYEQELALAETTHAKADDQVRTLEAQEAEMNRQRERLNGLQTQAKQIQREMSAIDGEVNTIVAEQHKHEAELRDYQAALDHRDEIIKGFEDLEALRIENDTLTSKLSSQTELNAQKTRAENQVADARRKLESERDGAERSLNELQRQADDSKLIVQRQHITQEQNGLNNGLADGQNTHEAERARLMRERDEALDNKSSTEAHNKQIEAEGKQKKASLTAIQKVGAVCPTCARPLGDEERAKLIAEWEAELVGYRDLFQANKKFVEQELARSKAIELQLMTLEQTTKRAAALQTSLVALDAQLSKTAEAAAQLPNARKHLDTLTQTLATQNYANEAQKTLAQVNMQLAGLGYDAKAHQFLRTVTLPRLQVFAARKAQLERAELGVQVQQNKLAELGNRAAALHVRRSDAQTRQSEAQAQILECQQLLRGAAEVANALGRAHAERANALRKVGEANQKVQSCKSLEVKRARLANELTDIRRRKSLLKDLRESFGKNGVPAMIIEVILPELEASSNDLLNRMTNGRMSVRFETQRATKSGDASETLDIRISDELGERPYEMYSGGEAFRINFAIRIALSKLLAHRQGAKLQTLFIDEGFGTQDTQGRERLIEAIRTIQDDFERLIVITHIDELKDAFPARIEVTKTAQGSMARIM